MKPVVEEMTPQKAIEILEVNAICSPQATKFKKAVEVAKQALEKQIPKKPLNPCGRYYGKAKGGNCPVCGAGTNSVTYIYCRKCGQALDWSDTE